MATRRYAFVNSGELYGHSLAYCPERHLELALWFLSLSWNGAMKKCSVCGYLAARHVESREIVEVEKQARSTGHLDQNAMGKIELVPLCFVRHIDIASQVAGTGKDRIRSTKSIIQQDRECGSFTPWTQGFTPKEHLAMNMLKQLEEQIRLNTEKREEKQRQWEEQRTMIQQEHEERMERNRREFQEFLSLEQQRAARSRDEAAKELKIKREERDKEFQEWLAKQSRLNALVVAGIGVVSAITVALLSAWLTYLFSQL